MVGPKGDRRIQRTKALLFEALLDLLIEKGYEAITIQDLIDRANIGRSTFYFHYVDKEDLLKDNIDQLRVFLKEQISLQTAVSTSEDFQFGFSLAFFQHVQGHKMIFRATVGKQSGMLVLHHMKRMIRDLVSEEVQNLQSINDKSIIPQEIVTDFIVDTLMILITWWMDQKKPCSVEEVNKMFHQLTLNGIMNL